MVWGASPRLVVGGETCSEYSRPAPAETQAATLTAVEREVADLVADGLSNQAIAGRLGLARVTVSQHVATILWRLGLRARHEIGRASCRERV